jgi:hypothetical protein
MSFCFCAKSYGMVYCRTSKGLVGRFVGYGMLEDSVGAQSGNSLPI